MNMLFNLVVVVQVLSALAIIGLVLVQHGKGADMGAAFGSGASGSLFGASGSSNFLSKSTAVAAAIFFVTTLGLASFGTNRPHASVGGGVMERVTVPVDKSANIPVSGAPAPAAGAPASAGDVVPVTTAPAAPAAAVAVPSAQGVPAAPAAAPAAPAAVPAAPAPAK
jgi:preprotein translocase subunit SecG